MSHHSEISRLQSEIDKLSSTVASLRSGKSGGESNSNYKASVKKKSKPQSQNERSSPKPPTSDNSKRSVAVENARKIWGTMKAATSKTVLSAIKHVAPNLNSLTVKRKFYVHNGSVKRWWHVIRGSKAQIDLLDSSWNKIQTQTGWKLQPLMSFSSTISALPVVATNLETSSSSPVNNDDSTTVIVNNLLPATAPVLDLSTFTPVSPQVSLTSLSASRSTRNTTTAVLESSHPSTVSLPSIPVSSPSNGASSLSRNASSNGRVDPLST